MERAFHPRWIHVSEGARRSPRTHDVTDQWPEAKVEFITNVGDVRPPGPGYDTALSWGKQLLCIEESRDYVRSRPEGPSGLPIPGHYDLTPATHCPFDCVWCPLQNTYGTSRPWVCLYTDLPEMLLQIDAVIARRDFRDRPRWRQPITFHTAGCDGLATLGLMPNLLPELVDHFATPGYDRLELRTRSANVLRLLDLDHGGNTILSFGLNPVAVIEQYEHGTASLDERLQAARACQAAGYPVELRIGPIVAVEDWRQQYGETVQRALRMARPDRITLEAYGLPGRLLEIMDERFPGSSQLNGKLDREGGVLYYGHRLRALLYRRVVRQIHEQDGSVPIVLSSETPRMRADLQRLLRSEQSVGPEARRHRRWGGPTLGHPSHGHG